MGWSNCAMMRWPWRVDDRWVEEEGCGCSYTVCSAWTGAGRSCIGLKGICARPTEADIGLEDCGW
jgi:hypothetical protein